MGSLVCRIFVSLVYKGSVNITGSVSNIFSCNAFWVFFCLFFLWACLRAAQRFLPLAFICSCIQHLEGVFMWLVMKLCQVKASTCFWPLHKLRGKCMDKSLDAGVERGWRGIQQLERGSKQTPKQSHAPGDKQRLSMNLSSLKANCYLVCLLFGEVSSADEFHWEKKKTTVFWFRPQPLWKKEKRELPDGELCEVELKVIWGATSLAVPASDLRWVCGITRVWNRQIHISDNLLHNSP